MLRKYLVKKSHGVDETFGDAFLSCLPGAVH